MEKLKDNLAMIWFVVSALALAVLTWVVHRKNVKISALVYDVQRTKLQAQIDKLDEKVEKNEITRTKARKRYNDLIRRHGQLLDDMGYRKLPDNYREKLEPGTGSDGGSEGSS